MMTIQRQPLRRLWMSKDPYATTLLVSFQDMFHQPEPGLDGKVPSPLNWDPTTIYHELLTELDGEPSTEAYDRLMAAIAVTISDRFFQNLHEFQQICRVFSGHHFNPSWSEPADSHDLAWGINEALLLSPPEKQDEEPFSQEIIVYIEQVLNSDGILDPPGVLRLGDPEGKLVVKRTNLAQEYADQPDLWAKIAQGIADRKQAIQSYVKLNQRNLLAQLDTLSLENGDVQNLRERLSLLKPTT
jgi:hypothetical protein